jgi:hypothetical protein
MWIVPVRPFRRMPGKQPQAKIVRIVAEAEAA